MLLAYSIDSTYSSYDDWCEPEPIVFFTDVDGARGEGVIISKNHHHPYDLYNNSPREYVYIAVCGDKASFGTTYAHADNIADEWQALAVVA